MGRQYREALGIAGRAKNSLNKEWCNHFLIEAPAQASKMPAAVAQFGEFPFIAVLHDFAAHGRIEIVEIDANFACGFAVNGVVSAESLRPPTQPKCVSIAEKQVQSAADLP